MIAVLNRKKTRPAGELIIYDPDWSKKFDYRDVMRAIQALKKG